MGSRLPLRAQDYEVGNETVGSGISLVRGQRLWLLAPDGTEAEGFAEVMTTDGRRGCAPSEYISAVDEPSVSGETGLDVNDEGQLQEAPAAAVDSEDEGEGGAGSANPASTAAATDASASSSLVAAVASSSAAVSEGSPVEAVAASAAPTGSSSAAAIEAAVASNAAAQPPPAATAAGSTAASAVTTANSAASGSEVSSADAEARAEAAATKLLESEREMSSLRAELSACQAKLHATSLELRVLKGDKQAAEEAEAAKAAELLADLEKQRAEHNRIQDLVGALRIACRVRPASSAEVAKKAEMAVVVEPRTTSKVEQTVRVIHQGAGAQSEPRNFSFTHVYGPDASQEDVFGDSAPLMTSVLDGFNVCIFAYGQSGTGKTFTMEGSKSDPGLAPRAMQQLFDVMDRRKAGGTHTHECFLSMLEIHNESIRDLLAEQSEESRSKKYDIAHDESLGMYVRDLVSKAVNSASVAAKHVSRGNANRAVGVTNLNEQSSRSHMILSLIVLTKNTLTGARHVGKLSLVDLAGSERLSKSQTTGQSAKESMAINKSLSALGGVLNALGSKAVHVPYRDSKLTYLLQDSLGGNSKTLMLVTCGPAKDNTLETVNSLTFASRAKQVTLGKAGVRELGGKAGGASAVPQRGAPARKKSTK